MCLMWGLGSVQPQNGPGLDAFEPINAADSLSGDPILERFTRWLWDADSSVLRDCKQNLTDPMVNRNDVKISKLELLARHFCLPPNDGTTHSSHALSHQFGPGD